MSNQFIRKTADQIQSLQELYNAICAWLLRPGASRSIGHSDGVSGPNCVYLGPGNNRCAVGAIMPEGDSGEDCDGDVDILYTNYKHSAVSRLIDRLGPTSFDLLCSMQSIHDDETNWNHERFIALDLLHDLAEQYNLVPYEP